MSLSLCFNVQKNQKQIVSQGTTLINAQLSFQDLFVLLDLLGSPNPMIVNHFENTAQWFAHLIATGTRTGWGSDVTNVSKCTQCVHPTLVSR